MPRSNRAPILPPSFMAQVRQHIHNRDIRAQQLHPPERKPDLQVVNKKGDGPAELRIYDAIGGWFGISAKDVADALDELDPHKELTVRLNSPGGDVFDGVAIYNMLRSRPGPTDVVVDGLAASAASFIAQAGDSIVMNRGTQMMIHDAIGFTIGNAADHREQVALLDRISNEIADIYAARAGSTVEEWREQMLATTWYSASEAVEAGLADSTADADDEELEEQVAAILGQPAAGEGGAEPPALVTAPPADPFADLPADAFAGAGAALADVFSPLSGYDAQVVGSTILDVYAHASAPPAVDPGPPPARTAIPIDEFVDALVTGLLEGAPS